MSIHRATHGFGASGIAAAPGQQGQSAGTVILFIAAVLVAGITCILYLWQQGQIVATQQDIRTLDARYTALLSQKGDLAAQLSHVNAVANVVAQASKAGMVMGDSRLLKTVDVAVPVPNMLVAQAPPAAPKQSVALPSTNAAITSWWQDAWDGVFNLLQ
jgi:cell division protein FtsL